MSGPWEAYQRPKTAPAAKGPWEQFRRPERPKRSAAGKVWDNVGAFAQAASEQIPFLDEAAAAGAALITGRPYVEVRQGANALAALDRKERPAARNAGGVAGFGALLAAPGAGYVARATTPGNALLRSAQVGAGYGAAASAGATNGGVSERGRAAVKGAVLGATAGAAIPAVAGGVQRVVTRAPRPVNPNVRALVNEGVQLTPGQMRGRVGRQIEDAATSVPILGPAISEARRRGVESYTRAATNRALRPIGEELPADIAAGQASTAYAGDRLSARFQDLVPEGGVAIDDDLAASLGAIPDVDTLRPESLAQLQNIIRSRVQGRFAGEGSLDGRTYQRVRTELENDAGRFLSSPDPDNRAIGQALNHVRSALDDAAARQNPEFAAGIGPAREGWAELTRVERAGASAGAAEGVFTPAQYGAAVRAGSDTVRKRGVARGEALGQDLADAGRAVLPSTLNDSGTATRGMIGMVLGGGAGALGGPIGLAASAAGLGVARQAYSPAAIEAANRALARGIARQDRLAALAELRRLSGQDAQTRQLYDRVAAQITPLLTTETGEAAR